MRAAGPPYVLALGEALVEIMRASPDLSLSEPGIFHGPFPSGAPAIFADACARLGLHAGFIGTVGDDSFGRAFRDRLQRDGVDITHLGIDASRATGTAFVAYKRDGGREFVFHLRHAAAGKAPAVKPEYLDHVRWLHITGSTLAGSPEWRDACMQAVAFGKQRGARVSFDPNIRPELLRGDSVQALCEPILPLTDVVLPSGDELTLITGISDRQSAIHALLARGVELVALKQGREGSVGYTRHATVHAPTNVVEERDPTGAGDAFAAGIAYALLHDLPLERALAIANEIGAHAVTRLGPMEGLPLLAAVMSANGNPDMP